MLFRFGGFIQSLELYKELPSMASGVGRRCVVWYIRSGLDNAYSK